MPIAIRPRCIQVLATIILIGFPLSSYANEDRTSPLAVLKSFATLRVETKAESGFVGSYSVILIKRENGEFFIYEF